jgi:hypothetical protein
MGARTDAARSEVLAARAALDEELVRLEAAGRASVDIPGRLRREPAKVLGAAGGAAFLLLGGPKRVLNGARQAVFGKKADVPKSMLPPEVEKTLKKLGPDGEKVRGTLEREFASYLEEKAPQRRERDLSGVAAGLLGSTFKPVVMRIGKQLAEQALNPDGPSFADGMRRARDRASAARAPKGGVDATNGSSGANGTGWRSGPGSKQR